MYEAGGVSLNSIKAKSLPALLAFNVPPEITSDAGALLVLPVHPSISWLKMYVQLLGLPKQWLAVRKYGVPSCAVLLTKAPVQTAKLPWMINATLLLSTDQGAPSGQLTLMLQFPELP